MAQNQTQLITLYPGLRPTTPGCPFWRHLWRRTHSMEKIAEGVEETHNLGRRTRAIPVTPLLSLENQGWMFRLDSCATVKRTPQLDGIAVLELDCTVNVQTVPFPSNISVFGAHHRRCWGARRSDSSGVHQCQKPPRAIASCRVESPTQAWVLQSCRFTIQ